MGAWPLLVNVPITLPSSCSCSKLSSGRHFPVFASGMFTGDWCWNAHWGATWSQSAGPYTGYGKVKIKVILDIYLGFSNFIQNGDCNSKNPKTWLISQKQKHMEVSRELLARILRQNRRTWYGHKTCTSCHHMETTGSVFVLVVARYGLAVALWYCTMWNTWASPRMFFSGLKEELSLVIFSCYYWSKRSILLSDLKIATMVLLPSPWLSPYPQVAAWKKKQKELLHFSLGFAEINNKLRSFLL